MTFPLRKNMIAVAANGAFSRINVPFLVLLSGTINPHRKISEHRGSANANSSWHQKAFFFFIISTPI
jgi:hypothetical protein